MSLLVGLMTFAYLIVSGFNMGNDLAVFLTYAAFLVDGNPLTNLLSIGGKTQETGNDPPSPAIVGGLDTHAVFEGTIFGLGHSMISKYLRTFSVFRGYKYD